MVGQVALRKSIDGIGEFVASGLFAASLLAIALSWTLAMALMMFWPLSYSPVGHFVANFRTWCFGYDPLTGQFDMAKVIMVILDPIFLVIIVAVVWQKHLLRSLKTQWGAIVLIFLASSGVIAASLTGFGRSQYAQERMAEEAQLYRTQIPAPRLHLHDQSGGIYDIKNHRVTVVAAFYAHCTQMCPLTVAQLRNTLAKLSPEQRSQVDVALVTLDPSRDTVAALAEISKNTGVGSKWRYLTGSPEEVRRVLDDYQVARATDRDGTIGHSNVFNLIDKSGHLAFRVSLSADDGRLKKALDILVGEGG